MPEISRFGGIVIRMYLSDHGPPHFHAYYGSSAARVGLSPVEVLNGDLPPRALRLTLEWAILNEAELMANWRRLRLGKPVFRNAPLE